MYMGLDLGVGRLDSPCIWVWTWDVSPQGDIGDALSVLARVVRACYICFENRVTLLMACSGPNKGVVFCLLGGWLKLIFKEGQGGGRYLGREGGAGGRGPNHNQQKLLELAIARPVIKDR